MQVTQTGNQQYRMTLSPLEVRIFINGMNETIRRISEREYQTRVGAEVDDIQGTIAALENVLK